MQTILEPHTLFHTLSIERFEQLRDLPFMIGPSMVDALLERFDWQMQQLNIILRESIDISGYSVGYDLNNNLILQKNSVYEEDNQQASLW